MQRFNSVSRSTRVVIALALAAVTLVSVNLFATESMQQWRADTTEGGLYTISAATRKVLSHLQDPITLRLYYSREIGNKVPTYAQYASRIRNLLSLYQSLAGGKLRVEYYDPKPFTEDEDRAVAAGLQGVSLGTGQTSVYLGLVGTNLTDNQQVIPFFNLDRSDFLEYDLTRLIYKLADPKRKVVGLLTSLPLAGSMNPQTGQPIPAWLVYQQMSDFFTVKAVSADMKTVPADVDILLVVSPEKLTEQAAYAIDQFALSGKPVMVFSDAFSETGRVRQSTLKKGDALERLFKSWGVTIAPDKAVGDIVHARRVQYQIQGQPTVTSYVMWMNFDKSSFDPSDAIFANVDRLVIASPGAITPVGGAKTAVSPLISTSDKAMLIDDKELEQPNPIKLLQAYKPAGKPFTLAARITGEAASAFPDGPPVADTAAKMSTAKGLKSGKINVVLVADSDLLYDSFWAQTRQVMGQNVVLPRANNADFLLNALENLSGGQALAGLRGRGVEARPFTLINDMQREAESKYRARQQALNDKLAETKKKIKEIQSKAQDGMVVLSDADKQAILGFRHDVLQIRSQLRAVQAALRADIQRLETQVKFINIAGVPLLIIIGLGLYALVRRLRRGKPGSDARSPS